MKSEQDTVFFDAAIIADDRAQRCDPAAEIAVNRVALLLQNYGWPLRNCS